MEYQREEREKNAREMRYLCACVIKRGECIKFENKIRAIVEIKWKRYTRKWKKDYKKFGEKHTQNKKQIIKKI